MNDSRYRQLTLPPDWKKKFLQHAFYRYAYCLMTCYLKVTVRGRQYIPSTPFLICSNHQSHLDSAILMHACGGHFNQYALLSAYDYWFAHPLYSKWMQNVLNLIPISRHKITKQEFVQMIESIKLFLENGNKAVILYPEGGRTINGQLQKPFKKGAAVLAKKLQIPILPVGIQGTYKLWPKGSKFLRPGRIEVNISKPLTFYIQQSSKRNQHKCSDILLALENNIEQLLGVHDD